MRDRDKVKSFCGWLTGKLQLRVMANEIAAGGCCVWHCLVSTSFCFFCFCSSPAPERVSSADSERIHGLMGTYNLEQYNNFYESRRWWLSRPVIRINEKLKEKRENIDYGGVAAKQCSMGRLGRRPLFPVPEHADDTKVCYYPKGDIPSIIRCRLRCFFRACDEPETSWVAGYNIGHLDHLLVTSFRPILHLHLLTLYFHQIL